MKEELKRKFADGVNQRVFSLKKRALARQTFFKDFDRRLDEIIKSLPDKNDNQNSLASESQQMNCD